LGLALPQALMIVRGRMFKKERFDRSLSARVLA